MRKLVTSTVSKPSFKCLANEEVPDRLYPGIMRVCVCVADLYEGEWDYTGQRVERNVCGRRPDAASRRRGRPCCCVEGCKNTVRSFRFCLIQSLVDGDVVEHPFGGLVVAGVCDGSSTRGWAARECRTSPVTAQGGIESQNMILEVLRDVA